MHSPQVKPSQGTPTRMPGFQTADAGSQRVDPAHDFVPGNDGVGDVGQFAVDDMQIRAAHAAGGHLDADFTRPGDGIRPFLRPQRRAAGGKHHRMHVTINP